MQRFDNFEYIPLLFSSLLHVVFKIKILAYNLQDVYSNVYPKKKTNQCNAIPSGWFSTVGPAGLEPSELWALSNPPRLLRCG